MAHFHTRLHLFSILQPNNCALRGANGAAICSDYCVCVSHVLINNGNCDFAQCDTCSSTQAHCQLPLQMRQFKLATIMQITCSNVFSPSLSKCTHLSGGICIANLNYILVFANKSQRVQWQTLLNI